MLADVLGNNDSKKSKANDASFRKLIAHGLASTRTVGPIPIPSSEDPSTFFRASAIGSACARKEAIKIVEFLCEQDTVDADLALVFAKGHAAHYLHQEHLVPAVAKKAMVGWWRADDAQAQLSQVGKLFSYEQAVAHFGHENVRYVEPHLFDFENRLKGHPDLILDWDLVENKAHGFPSGREIVEFKTRNWMKSLWDAVDPEVGGEPLPKHVLQVQAYMMMTGIKRARIVYLRKGDFSDLQDCYAEHVVTADKEVHKNLKKFLDAWRDAIKAAYAKGEIPERTKCATFDCQLAKSCALRYRCFGKKTKNEPVVPCP
jgi:hypothetical protein